MRSHSTWIVGWGAALLTIAVFASLGRWQLGRMHEKQAMLDAVEQTLAAHRALPLSVAADPARGKEYDWAAGEGEFVDAPAVLLDNQMRNGRSGVRAYRLFVAADSATPLLVELGWLPLQGGRAMPSIARPAAAMRVAGLLSPPPSAGVIHASPQPQADGNLLATVLDPPSLGVALGRPGVAPRVLKLDPALDLGYARDLDVLPNTLPPQQHLGYAVQWFALALTVLVTATFLSLRALRRRPTP